VQTPPQVVDIEVLHILKELLYVIEVPYYKFSETL
jgi:hypothetical protein